MATRTCTTPRPGGRRSTGRQPPLICRPGGSRWRSGSGLSDGSEGGRRLADRALKIRREFLLGIPEDVDDRLAVRERESGPIPRVLLLAGEDVPQALVDRRLRGRRQRVERGGVDQVAAGGLHQATGEIELVERAALSIARPA